MPVLKEDHENPESCLTTFSSLNSSPKIIPEPIICYISLYKTQQKEEVL